MNVHGHGVNKMAIKYTWEIEIKKITPYNIKSSQQNIVDTLSYVLIGEDRGTKSNIAGSISFDTRAGVNSETFKNITEIDDAELQSWVENRVGSDRVAEMKKELEDRIKNLPDNFNPMDE